MNEADSQRLAIELEKTGLIAAENADDADVIVLNTCVVRQSAEDRTYGRLGQLKHLKAEHPNRVIGVMGCLVGVRDPLPLRQKFPFVDVFMAPSDPTNLVQFLRGRANDGEAIAIDTSDRRYRDALQDEEFILPSRDQGTLVSAHVPVMFGCSHACSFCVIPFRRGIERSRPLGTIIGEIRALGRQGVREVTLLGQIVDRYGKDVVDGPNLAALLRAANEVDGIQRVRFLTSHPNWMTNELLDAVADLPKVCEHIEVPIQAGDDVVLQRMKRGYTQAEYRRLIERIRARIPTVAIHTDIIVGFPGETDKQFEKTYQVLEELKVDKAHVAMYSPRPNTVSARTMEDDVPAEVKKRRLEAIDSLQETIVAEINRQYVGRTVEVLIEDRHNGKWRGRTRLNKLVFFEDSRDFRGLCVDVEITKSGAWSMQGHLAQDPNEYPGKVSLATDSSTEK